MSIIEQKIENTLQEMPQYELRSEFDQLLEKKLRRRFKIQALFSGFDIGINAFTDRFKQSFLFRLSLMMGMFLLVFTGYTYSSPSVTYGDSLFTYKKTLENIRLIISPTQADELKTYLAINNSRLNEMRYLTGIKDDFLIKSASAANGQVTFNDVPGHPLIQTLDEINYNADQLLIQSFGIYDVDKLKIYLNSINSQYSDILLLLNSLQKNIGITTDDYIMVKFAQTKQHIKNNILLLNREIVDLSEVEALGIKTTVIDFDFIRSAAVYKSRFHLQSEIEKLDANIVEFNRRLMISNIKSTNSTKILLIKLNKKLTSLRATFTSGQLGEAINELEYLQALYRYANDYYGF